MPAHVDGHGGEVDLRGAYSDDGPGEVLPAEEDLGFGFQEGEVFGRPPDAAQHTHDELNMKGGRHQPSHHEMVEIVEVPHIVDLQLRLGLVLPGDGAQVFEVLEGVLEDEVLAHLQVFFFPGEPEFLDGRQGGVEGEIDGAQVEGAHLGLEGGDGGRPLLNAHLGRAAGGDADDGVALFPDPEQDLPEVLDVGRREAVLGPARVDVDDGGPGLGRLDGGIGDLPGGDGKIGSQRRYGGRPGDGGGDDQLFHIHSSSKMATGRTHPALAFFILTGKQQTVNPKGRPMAERLAIFSMWQ